MVFIIFGIVAEQILYNCVCGFFLLIRDSPKVQTVSNGVDSEEVQRTTESAAADVNEVIELKDKRGKVNPGTLLNLFACL